MKNYIPIDFFENNKTTTYAQREHCEKMEGVKAISFIPKEIDLSVSKIVNGKIVHDETKKQKRDFALAAEKAKRVEIKKLIKTKSGTLKVRFEALVEHLGLDI